MRDDDPHPAVLVLFGVLAVALLPGLLTGVAAAELLRHRGLRWTWTLPANVAAAIATTVTGSNPFTDFAAALERAATGDSATLLAAGLPVWALAAAPSAAAWQLWRGRRDRLHGGSRERAAREARGISDVLRRSKPEGPIYIGTDARGFGVHLPELRAHATILGGSNSGKTNTAQVLLEEHVAEGAGFIVLDGKGGRDLPRAAVALASRHGRRVALWSVLPYGDQELDAHRRPWNPIGNATPTEAKDRIAASEEQTEPYYKAVASRGLLTAARALAAEGHELRLDALASSLESPGAVAGGCTAEHGLAAEREWLENITDSERSALRGMATRLHTMVASDGGAALLPEPGAPQIDLYEAVRNGDLVVFTLPQGAYPELVPHVARYALQALSAVCTKIEQRGEQANALVFVDELSAFDGDQLCAGFERGRSAGVRFIVATQSLSNLASAGEEKLLHAALDNAELLVIHRQAVPEAVELLAGTGGTEEAWEHTHVVSDAAGYPFGLDETGARQRRLTDRFRAHPNVIKQLRQGEAVVVAQRPEFAVRHVRVRPA